MDPIGWGAFKHDIRWEAAAAEGNLSYQCQNVFFSFLGYPFAKMQQKRKMDGRSSFGLREADQGLDRELYACLLDIYRCTTTTSYVDTSIAVQLTKDMCRHIYIWIERGERNSLEIETCNTVVALNVSSRHLEELSREDTVTQPCRPSSVHCW